MSVEIGRRAVLAAVGGQLSVTSRSLVGLQPKLATVEELSLGHVDPLGRGEPIVHGTADGDFVLAGSPVDGQGVLLLRLRPDGSVRWRRTYLDQDVEPVGLADGPDGGLVFVGDVRDGPPFVLSVASDGAARWTNRVYVPTDGPRAFTGATSVAAGPDGQAVVGGTLGTDTDGGDPSLTGYVVALDDEGTRWHWTSDQLLDVPAARFDDRVQAVATDATPGTDPDGDSARFVAFTFEPDGEFVDRTQYTFEGTVGHVEPTADGYVAQLEYATPSGGGNDRLVEFDRSLAVRARHDGSLATGPATPVPGGGYVAANDAHDTLTLYDEQGRETLVFGGAGGDAVAATRDLIAVFEDDVGETVLTVYEVQDGETLDALLAAGGLGAALAWVAACWEGQR